MPNSIRKHNYPAIALMLITWSAFAILTSIFKSHESTKILAGIWPALGGTVLNFAIIGICIWLWKNAVKESKLLFMFFTFSFSCFTIPYTIYILLFKIFQLNVPYLNASTNLLVLHHIPYMICVFFEFLAWLSVALYMLTSPTKFKHYAPMVIVACLILLMFIWIYGWKFNFSETALLSKVFKIYITSFYIINFTIASLCLATCKNRAIFYLSLGYIIIVGADLILDFDFMSQTYGIGSLFDTIWFLGTLFMLYGFLDFKKSLDYKLNPKYWISEPNSIKTQIALWCFALCASCLGVFLVANSILEPKGVFF